MATARIIFPHQLFEQIAHYTLTTPIVLIEEWLYFKQYAFHQQKLVLHRASMQYYQQWLQQKGFTVWYVEANHTNGDIRKCLQWLLVEKGITHIQYTEVVDNWLEKRIQNTCKKLPLTIEVNTTTNFLNTAEDGVAFFKGKKTFFQTDFYVYQRKLRALLLEDGKPLGGKWTYDAENREKYPSNAKPPKLGLPQNHWVKQARSYVQQHFGGNYGTCNTLWNQQGFYATTHEEAKQWLQQFLEQRFEHFGIYEDALHTHEPVLHHSVLTPMLNTGLLTPQQIVQEVLQYASNHAIPLNSLEGFIRQIIGWREFIRIVYHAAGTKQRTTNYWNFTHPMPASFYDGTTGIIPIDNAIHKLLESGYNHHIERLMLLGNFMLLCEIHPDAVHQWFMEMYIDSYDWVMVPNVYGMTQFADGGLMTTKPYISGSNYVLKMGTYAKGPWQAIWDGLFWRFMHVHRAFFSKNPRLGMLLKTFDKMAPEKQQAHLTNAEQFLNKIHGK